MTDPTFWVMIAFVVFVIICYPPLKKEWLALVDNEISSCQTTIDAAENFLQQEAEKLQEVEFKRSHAETEALKIKQHAEAEEKRFEHLLHVQRSKMMSYSQSLVQRRYELGLYELENKMIHHLYKSSFQKVRSRLKTVRNN